MARYKAASCRLCRRQGTKLFLKGTRCATEKCSFIDREHAPGQHGHVRAKKLSNYALQLREKQKVKRMYGVLEKQFLLYFKRAERSRGVTGEKLLELLERRLDNAVFRMGLATSRPQARQLVRHRHVMVNGKKIDIPSYTVKQGDVITVSAKDKIKKISKERLEEMKDVPLPSWLTVDREAQTGTVTGNPSRDDVQFPIQEQLIVELYSK
ncbi:MAG: 30S ribosomal protein S4 [Candidatus Omnitrophica bacterium]|nr:30S ribosomal protein S4 [Candidatus Omnitrophota bacterium]